MAKSLESVFVNFTQACRECKKYYQIFKVDINKCYDEKGKSVVTNEDLYEKFSFSCKNCFLFNIINFSDPCNEETVIYLRKNHEENERRKKKTRLLVF